jgi:hypothetical protein
MHIISFLFYVYLHRKPVRKHSRVKFFNSQVNYYLTSADIKNKIKIARVDKFIQF